MKTIRTTSANTAAVLVARAFTTTANKGGMKMKLIGMFAFGLVCMGFLVEPAFAGTHKTDKCVETFWKTVWTDGLKTYKKECVHAEAEQIDELKDPDRADNERSVADSGNEGSTSAASAGNQ